MYIFAEPMTEHEIDAIQNSQKEKIAQYERTVMGIEDEELIPECEADDASQQSESQTQDQTSNGPASITGVAENTTTLGDAQGVGAEEPGWEAVDEQVEEDIAKDGASPAREEQENTASVGQALTPTKANEVGASENPAASDDDSNRAADTSPTESSLPAEQPAESATEKSAEDYSTTESAADRPFLSANKPDTLEEDLRPLLAFTLTVRNRVNGSYIDRPKKLEPTDEWKVEYVLKEFSRPSNAWSLYEATKARRAAKYGRFSAADDDEGLNESYYIRMLRQLSQKGRELRAQMDEADQDKAKVVVGHAMSECSDFRQAPSFKVAASPDMASVEDYLAWLYKKE